MTSFVTMHAVQCRIHGQITVIQAELELIKHKMGGGGFSPSASLCLYATAMLFISTSTCSSPDALLKCWKAVSPRPPTPHTMYCSMLRGSMGISHVLSSANKHIKTYTLQTKQTIIICTCSHPNYKTLSLCRVSFIL